MLKRMRTMKDQAIAAALRAYVADKLSPYGQLLDVRVDTAAQQVEATAQLNGEAGPITVRVEHYRIERDDGRLLLRLETITCSRDWIGMLLTRIYGIKPIKLPGPIAALL